MLKDLEQYFIHRGWYSGTHPFLSIRLEGGFEAFSGRASETWEYRWVVGVHANLEMEIPAIMVKGNVYQSLDDICADVLAQLKQNIKDKEEGIVTAEMHKSMHDNNQHFVDWNQYSLDQLADYLNNKYMFLSSGEALAVHKLVEFYQKNKKK
jgi:hypothetical protein